ncbi:MAG: DUF3182 family protein [Spongiibacteraceae bacterium]
MPRTHESVTRSRMAEKLAALKGFEYAGEYSRAIAYDSLYFVPSETLLLTQACELGIANQEHLFGGCVSEPFIGSKSITHPLFSPQALAPAGWTPGFAQDVARVVLRGYSAFSIADARAATAHLLKTERARLKPALGIGGTGQTVIAHIDELDAALAAIDPEELGQFGVVIEQDLEEVITYSVGCAEVAGIPIAYYGTQSLTRNHCDQNVYGGSSLHIVRGDFQTLQGMDLPSEITRAVAQACVYDQAAQRHLPGFFASRRNYDVAQGMDRKGQICTGVLEQSWRIGGASPAEIAALEAFAADSRLHTIHVSTCERYGIGEPPAAASVHFRGIDGRAGAIAKYTMIDAYEYSADPA